MHACILQKFMEYADKDLYDLRYFSFFKDKGGFSCGMAHRTLVAIYREHSLYELDGNVWLTTISQTKNAVVKGFLAEQACLGAIKRNGLPAVSSTLDRGMDWEVFDNTPNWATLISNRKSKCRLYLPSAINYANIDAAILSLDQKKKKAHVYPIQVTLSPYHKDSAKGFYEKQWERWRAVLETEGYEVSSSFVWIDAEGTPGQRKVQPLVKHLRSGNKEVLPAYELICINFKEVERRFHNMIF